MRPLEKLLILGLVGVFFLSFVSLGSIPFASASFHDPISIDGNSDFTEPNGVTSGAGTENNPYIIENWSIAQSGMTGLGISIQNTTDYFIIRNCTVANAYSGIYLSDVTNGRIENTISTGNRIGLAGQRVSNSTFDNNDFSNNVNTGMSMAASTYNTFINNVAKYNSTGLALYFSNTSHHNTVDNNDFSNNSSYGIWLYPSSYDNIKNNTVSNNGSYGIYLWYASNENITNNTCEYNIYGIYLTDQSNNNLLDNNNCSNNSSGDIFIAPSCTNNTIIPFADGGIVLTGRGPITISSNSDFTEPNGVTSGAGTVGNPYIIENWIINSPSGTLDGISISNTTSYFIIRNCIIGATGQSGETGYRNHDGVHLYKVTNGTIQNNVISMNTGNGIFLEISGNNTIDNNICTNNDHGVGIVLSFSSNNILTNNTCSGNGGPGIMLQYSSSNNTLDSNTCTGNLGSDIFISSTCVGNVLTGNVGTVVEGPVGGETAFTISIDPATQSGLGGATLVYTVTIKNTGEGTDIFTFTVSDTAGWDPLISPASLTLARMSLGTSTLTVYIPVDAEDGTTDNITVSVIGTTGLGGSASCKVQVAAPSVVSPGVSGLVTLFLPFTGGDAVTAGYLTGIFFFIAPLTIMGLAVVAAAKARQYAGLLILGFFLLGMFMCVLTGLFPWWFLIFIIAVLALVFARGWSGGGKD